MVFKEVSGDPLLSIIHIGSDGPKYSKYLNKKINIKKNQQYYYLKNVGYNYFKM